MKIKTVTLINPHAFDNEVNEYLEKGYILVERGILTWDRGDKTGYTAQLVLPDPPAEPEPVDPIKALHQVKEFCRNVPAHTCKENCPLFYWCDRYAGDNDPCDWHLPEVLDE